MNRTKARIGPLVSTVRAAVAGVERAQSVSKLAPSLLTSGGTTMPLGTLGLRYGKPSDLAGFSTACIAALAASPTFAARRSWPTELRREGAERFML